MDTKPNYYAIIPADVRYADIPPAAKLLFGELTALTSKEGFCWAPNSYFAELYGVHTNSITGWIGALEEAGFIRTEVNQAAGNKRKIWLVADKFGVPLPQNFGVAPTKNRGSSISITKNKDFVGQNVSFHSKQSSRPTTDENSKVDVDGEGMPVPAKGRQTAPEGRGKGFEVLRGVHDLMVKETGLEPILGPVALKAINRALQHIEAKDVLLMVEDALANGYAEKMGMSLNAILSDAQINKFRLENQ